MPSSLSKDNETLARDLGKLLFAMINVLEAVRTLSGIGAEQGTFKTLAISLFEMEDQWINAVVTGDVVESQLFVKRAPGGSVTAARSLPRSPGPAEC